MVDKIQNLRQMLITHQVLLNGRETGMGQISDSLVTAFSIVADLPGIPPEVIREAFTWLITRPAADIPEPERMPEQWTPVVAAGLMVRISKTLDRLPLLAKNESDARQAMIDFARQKGL